MIVSVIKEAKMEKQQQQQNQQRLVHTQYKCGKVTTINMTILCRTKHNQIYLPMLYRSI